MQKERFKIKNANSEEIEIKVITENNVVHPEFDAYSSFDHIMERNKQNYRDIHSFLSSLIEKGILTYEKQEGNKHIFKHIAPNSNEFKYESVSVGLEPQFEARRTHGGMVDFIALPSNYDGARTLENMLYTVCQAHNISAPAIIRPKNMFMTMYNRVMYPATPDAEIQSAVVTTLALGTAAVVYCGIRLANKFRS